MKHPHEDSGGESDVKMRCVSLEGVPSQGEEGGHDEIAEEDPEDVEGGEDQDQGEGEIEDQGEGESEDEEERTPREVEEDLRFREELSDLKTRQLEPKVVNSLQNLSLQCVNNNTEYFVDKQELINRLPVPMFGLVSQFLLKTHSASPLIVGLLISEKSRELTVQTDDPWTSEDVISVLSLIEEKCKHTLSSLQLDVYKKCSSASLDRFFPEVIQINVILSSLKNLTQLDVGSSFRCPSLNDDTLTVLGVNCRHLRSLRMDYSKNITDVGIFYLCASAAPYGQCKNLETLSLRNSSVSEYGLVTALTNLPKLKILNCQYELFFALEKFVEINGESKQLQLKQLSSERDLTFKSAALKQVCKILPHLTSVQIYMLENLSAFFNVEAICEFEFFISETSLPEFNLFITKFSSTLTSIKINYCNIDIDISIFGLCKNLKELRIFSDIESANEFQLLPNSFMKLEKVDISPMSYTDGMEIEIDVTQLISSPTLKEITLHGIKLSETNLYSLIVEAKECQQFFSNLESFDIRGNDYSLEILMQFICVCPKLKRLNAFHCMSVESYLQLKRFANRNNLTDVIM